MRISQLILYFQVVAAAGFTPTGEVERRRTRAEKGAKDFFKEELWKLSIVQGPRWFWRWWWW